MNMSVRFPNLGLEFEYVPVSVRVFGFEITFFGILLAVGMLLGIAFVVLEAKRKKQDANLYLGMMISGLAGGFIGARFFYVLLSWSVYKTDIMKVFDTRNGGMVFYEGLLGGVLAAAVFCRVKYCAGSGFCGCIRNGSGRGSSGDSHRNDNVLAVQYTVYQEALQRAGYDVSAP